MLPLLGLVCQVLGMLVLGLLGIFIISLVVTVVFKQYRLPTYNFVSNNVFIFVLLYFLSIQEL